MILPRCLRIASVACISPVNPSSNQSHLRHQVRYATNPDSPQVIREWLLQSACCNAPKSSPVCEYCSPAIQRAKAEYQFLLLMEVVSDDLLPGHWRTQCLDAVYQPLSCLRALADSPQRQHRVRYLEHTLRMCSHYFMHSMTHQRQPKNIAINTLIKVPSE